MSRARDTSSTILPIFISVMAIIALVVVVVGTPIALIYLVGWPVPNPLPTGAELGDIFAGRAPIPGDYLVSLLAVVMWILWSQFAWAAVVEVVAAIRGRLASRARVLPGVQATVGKMVAAATLIATSMTSKPVAAGPLVPVVATQSVDPASTSPEETADGPSVGDPKPYMTKQGDTWWGIAEETLGAGTRWKELRGLNLGRTMADGSTISAATDLLKPEWRLLLPSNATVAEIGTGGPGRQVTVERGDTIWAIAKEDLADTTTAADPEQAAEPVGRVAEHAERIAEINNDQLKGNPDMIYPGQTLSLPGGGTPSAEVRTEEPEADGSAPAQPAAPTVRPPMPTIDASPPAVGTGERVQRSTPGPIPEPTGDEPQADISADRSSGPAVKDTEPSSGEAGAPNEEAGAASEGTASSTGLPETPVADTGESSEIPTNGATMLPQRQEQASPETDDDERTGIGTVSLAGVTAEAPGRPTPTSPPPTPIQPSIVAEEQSAPQPSREFRRGPAPDGELQAIDAPSAEVVNAPVTASPADLETGSELSETEITIGRAAGEASPKLGTDADNRAPVFIGLAALTLIGGYLHKAKGRRRETALRHRHPGKRPAQPKRRTKSVARRLAAASGPEHPEFVNVGLRALSRQLRKVPARRLPEVAGVWVADDRLVIAFTEDSPALDPPEPFTEFLDGSSWSLSRSDFNQARQIAEGANGPMPLLTTLGTTTALDLALTTSSRGPADAYGLSTSLLFAMDLEPGRVISLAATDEATTMEVLTTMALELATSETADQAEIVCVGFGHRLAAMERVIVVEEISEILPDLESITSRAIYAAADATPFATRVGNGAVDTWNPVVVLHADPNDPLVETLIDLASRTVGGVTAICGYPTGSGWTIQVDGTDIRCPNLPGQLSQHEFKRPQLEGTNEVLEIFEESVTEVDLDDEFWEPMEPINVDEFNWGGPTEVSSKRPSTDAVDLAADSDPDALWDSLSHVDADSWPDTELPALKRLRHSIEQMSEEDLGNPAGSVEEAEDLVDENFQLRREPDLEDPDTTEQRRLSAAEVQSIRAIRPRDRDHRVQPEVSSAAENTGDRDRHESLDDSETVPEVRVSVLGTLTIEGHHVSDTSKPWKYTKTPELILYLLMYPDGASQDVLMERLFPEQPPNRPRLNQLVSDARTKALGKNGDGEYHLPHASPTEPFYRLLPSVGFDLRDFAQHCANARNAESLQVQQREWTAALELVRGRPFSVPNDGYEWAVPEVEATIVKVEEAASELTDIAFELGDYELAVWATKRGLLTGTGYYELLVKRGKAAMLLQDPEEIVRAFADLQASLEYGGVPEEGMPDLSAHPELQSVYDQLSSGGRSKERSGRS